MLTEAEGENSPSARVTRALGGALSVTSRCPSEIDSRPGEPLSLCSDGPHCPLFRGQIPRALTANANADDSRKHVGSSVDRRGNAQRAGLTTWTANPVKDDVNP